MPSKETSVSLQSLRGAKASATLNNGEMMVVFNTMKGFTFVINAKDPEHFDLIMPTDRPGQPPRIRGEIAAVDGLEEHLQDLLFSAIAN
ncbi:TPA: hypothetical protein ACGW3W_002310 [Pseudomonas aeruginosa]